MKKKIMNVCGGRIEDESAFGIDLLRLQFFALVLRGFECATGICCCPQLQCLLVFPLGQPPYAVQWTYRT